MGAKEPWYPKLLELTDPDIRIHGYRWDGVLDHVEAGFLETQNDAYMADPRLHGIFREFYNEWAQGARRTLIRALPQPPMEAIENFFQEPHPINPRELIEVLAQMRDPISSQIVRAFRNGEFQLQILEDAEFERRARYHPGGTRSRFWSGYTAREDPSYPMTQIVLRQIRNVSTEVFHRLVFERLVTLIHEYDHHLYASQAATPSMRMLEEEMGAHLRHMQFRMRHGNRRQTLEILRRSPLGLAMYLRDRIEAVYLASAEAPAGNLRPLEPLEAAAASRVQRLEEAFDRSQGLLELSLDQSLELLRQGRVAGELRGGLQDSLAEAGRLLEEQRRELKQWVQEADPEIPPALEAAGMRYAALFRSQENLVLALDLLDREPSPFELTLLRRRIDWVLNEGGLARDWDWDWDAVPWVRRRAATAPAAPDRRAWGRFLLESFHPNPTEEDSRLFEEVASGPIRDRDLTFDLDDTLGDTVARHVAYQVHEKVPQRYDQAPGQAVHQHQRIRLVYRHMTSLLLGLWAAGNRLRLLTASDNYPGNHDAFFNDNPAFKVAFHLNAPETPEEWLRASDLEMAPRYLDRLGYQEAFTREFGGPEGRAFLEGIRRERGLERLPPLGSGKIPLAGFPFEVLVDDWSGFDQEMRTVGLGERWVAASQNGSEQWRALLEFFARPREGASESWRRWRGRELP